MALFLIILNSLIFACIAAALSNVIGFITAWSLYRYKIPMAGFLRYLMIALYFLPSQIYILSLMQSFSLLDTNSKKLLFSILYSYTGIVIVAGIIHIPISFFLFESAIKSIGQQNLDIAKLYGASDKRLLCDIVIPMIKKSILKIYFVISVTIFGNLTITHTLATSKQIEFFMPYLIKKLKSSTNYNFGDLVSVILLLSILIFSGGLILRKKEIESNLNIKKPKIKSTSNFATIFNWLITIIFIVIPSTILFYLIF